MTRFFILLAAFLHLGVATAQQDPFEEMRQRMMEMQHRMMQQLQQMQPGAPGFQQDTSFFFRFDTAFSGDWGRGNFQFFRSAPFGSDSLSGRVPMGDFWGFDSFFDDFFNFALPPGQPRAYPGPWGSPADDGTLQPDDGLLPEERLRQQEQKKSKMERADPPADKIKDKKPKVQTIRI